MTYSYRSKRISRKYAKKSKANFFTTILIIGVIIYGGFFWVLPFLVNGMGSVRSKLSPSPQKSIPEIADSTLAPPVLNIPYEATNSSSINISGYASADSKVKIYLSDTEIKSVEVNSDGTFIVENIDLFFGENTLYGKTTSGTDESLSSKTINIIYDDKKPILEISEPEDNKIVTGERKIKISGKTEFDVSVFINGSQAIVSSDGTFSFIHSLNDGENNITIKAIDKATNSLVVTRKVIFQI